MTRFFSFFLLVCCCFSARANADYKIVTVDVNRVINESREAKAKRAELDGLYSKTKEKLEGRRKGLEEADKKLKAGIIKADSKEAEKFRTDAREFTRLTRDSEEDLRKEFLKLNKTLTEKALKTIREYAQANKIDLVLDKAADGHGPVLVGSPSADITDEIVVQINK